MCPDRQILSLYIDNELPSPWKEKTEAHLATCESCRSRYESYRKLSMALQDDRHKIGDEAVKKAQEAVWAKFPASMTDTPEQSGFSIVRRKRAPGWKRISMPIPVAAAAAAVFVFAALFAVRGFVSPVRVVYEPVTSIVSDEWIGADPNGMIHVSDMAAILQYLSRQDSSDYMVIQLPESRNFYRSGEPTLLRQADYSQRVSPRRRAVSP